MLDVSRIIIIAQTEKKTHRHRHSHRRTHRHMHTHTHTLKHIHTYAGRYALSGLVDLCAVDRPTRVNRVSTYTRGVRCFIGVAVSSSSHTHRERHFANMHSNSNGNTHATCTCTRVYSGSLERRPRRPRCFVQGRQTYTLHAQVSTHTHTHTRIIWRRTEHTRTRTHSKHPQLQQHTYRCIQ